MKLIVVFACLFLVGINAFFGNKAPRVPSLGRDEEKIKRSI